MSFSIITAIGKNRELGKDGQLIWHLPSDLAYFKEKTMSHPILMGHKTFDSLPKVLPGRKHYVLSRGNEIVESDDVEVVSDLADFIEKYRDDENEIFVIGGGMVYWQMLKHCDRLYLTEIDAEDDDADTFFPDFQKDAYDKEILGQGEDDGIKYSFVLYTKKK